MSSGEAAVEIRRIRADEGLRLKALRLRALADAPMAFGSNLAREEAFADATWHERASGGASGTDRAPVLSVHLEGSSDGVSYAAVAPDASGTIRVTDPAASGARRWYRATACDANRNCATATAGPVSSGAGGGSTTLLASARPALSSVSAQRPRTCGTSLRIAFTARGRGPLAWVADVAGGGIKLRRSGRLAAARRYTVQVRLPRLPTCGRRVTVTLRLTSSHGR